MCVWRGLERWRTLGHMLITGLETGYGPTAGKGGYGPPSRRHAGVEVYLHSFLISK